MTILLRRAALACLTLVAVALTALTLGAGTASAHVSVGSFDATPGGFGEITFRMPSESDTARTTSLRVQLPTGAPFAFVSVQPVPGWTATTTTSPLPTPVEAEGTTITEAVSEITWTADPGGGLAPGEYQGFSISAGPLPEDAGSLVFPAVQGYDDGSTVAWIDPTVAGQPEPEHPAPVLTLTTEPAAPPVPAVTTAPDTTAAGEGSGLAVTALVAGLAGLLAGTAGVALALGARRRADAPAAPVSPQRDIVDA